MRGATKWLADVDGSYGEFQPTLPARGATFADAGTACALLISTHAPRTGSDPEGGENTINVLTFQPTLPARGATRQLRRFRFRLLISTHAPRTGSDETRVSSRSAQLFQPTLPARGATRKPPNVNGTTEFQPTLPARGATLSRIFVMCAASNFNPRSPHGERRCGAVAVRKPSKISTHAPRTGSDRPPARNRAGTCHFNPRSPHGERRKRGLFDVGRYCFNPRSPHGERPLHALPLLSPTAGFNPRSPHGERPSRETRFSRCRMGVSTHAPRTGSDTGVGRQTTASTAVSTHAPRTGSDTITICGWEFTGDFNPRSPHGERRLQVWTISPCAVFQPTLPARGATPQVRAMSMAA